MEISKSPAVKASMQNKKGNVLVVSYYLPPDISPGSLRISSLMEGLHHSGWDVSAVTVKTTLPATRAEKTCAEGSCDRTASRGKLFSTKRSMFS